MRSVPGEQHLADHMTKGKSWREIDGLTRGGRATQGTNASGRSGRDEADFTAPTSREAGWNKNIWIEYFAKDQGVRQAHGDRLGRNRKTGGKVKYDVGHPPEDCRSTDVEQQSGRKKQQESRSSRRRRQARMQKREDEGNVRDDGRKTTQSREAHEALNCHVEVIFIDMCQRALFKGRC